MKDERMGEADGDKGRVTSPRKARESQKRKKRFFNDRPAASKRRCFEKWGSK